jgi:hypothetical protein
MHPISMRVTAEAREQLAKAAQASGRSLAAEVELRLAQSFDSERRLAEMTERVLRLEKALDEERSSIAFLSYAVASQEDKIAAWRRGENPLVSDGEEPAEMTQEQLEQLHELINRRRRELLNRRRQK